MTDWFFKTGYSSWQPNDDGPEDRAWKRVYASGRLTMGSEVAAFEEEFAVYHGRRHCIMVNSGSSANEIAVWALRTKHDRLIKPGSMSWTWANLSAGLPAIAWSTTYGPIVRSEMTALHVCDVDETWNADWRLFGDNFLTVGCSILGNPADLSTLRLSTRDAGYWLLEDNCEAVGARTAKGDLCGTFGDLSTFSFFYSHQLSAVEGGAILTDHDDLAHLCRLLRNHGNEGWGAETLEDQYDFSTFGFNLRPLECHAAVAREQLKKLDEMVEQRRQNLAHFISGTEGLPIAHQRTTGQPSPFGLAFSCGSREDRNRLALALRAKGIDSRLPTGGSFLAHRYGAPWRDQSTPRADEVHRCGMFLGNAPFDLRPQIDQAIAVMRETL
jgi:CDP-4-dehydro-6-deoxyglucose reductase, E1